MRVDGEWLTFHDGYTRPVVRLGVETADGEWYEVPFVVDTGADDSMLCYGTFSRLGIDMTADPSRHYIGIGGRVDAGKVATRMKFTLSDGRSIPVNGPFQVSPDPAGVDLDFLGRDVLSNFIVIVDRPSGVVCLLSGNHTYTIRPA